MIKHIVMWKLKDVAEGNTKEQNALLMKEGLEGLKNVVPQIKKIEIGLSNRNSKDDFDVVLISEFASKKDLDEYQHHPKHNIVNAFILKVRAERVCVDFEA